MMQSLLNGTVSAKSNDLKAHKESDKIDSAANHSSKSKLTEEQNSFSKVLKDNIEQDSVAIDNKDNIEAEPSEVVNDKSSAISDQIPLQQPSTSNNNYSVLARQQNNVEELNASDVLDVKMGENEDINNIQNEQLLLGIQSAQKVDTKVNSNSNEATGESATEFDINNQLMYLDENLATLNSAEKNSKTESADLIALKNTSQENTVDTVITDSFNSLVDEQITTDLQSHQVINNNADIQAANTIDSSMATKNVEGNISATEKIEPAISALAKDNVQKNNKITAATDSQPQPVGASVSGTTPSSESEPVSIEAELQTLKKLEQDDSVGSPIKHESTATAQTVTDVNGARPNQTSLAQLDKLMAGNQQQQATNNLLQQPLDIQSKQAAAMMGERVMMMISQGKQEVQIRLDPAELGSMFIKVHVQQDQLQLNIQTQAGLSKDIIEQNMPRLREQLAQQGIQLGEANVQQQSQQQGQQQQNNGMNAMSGGQTHNNGMVEEEQIAVWMPSKVASTDQGIDFYA
ncbi:flagellar hook-length control protein FliK [Psychromonas sp. SR45-3]|uniref:flagellar hook-length control protein FliK n=1 Tax=Psychromonas sp. SR45-3 TaxID=2760930 RepID=UPI0015F870CB|nr:flagellar hook-length control protein FliK [Psychromonas sp. SR45-3]MBB1271684.1 flagellar hook-length control protein FliK [Psychromonas sp. SR45-3]